MPKLGFVGRWLLPWAGWQPPAPCRTCRQTAQRPAAGTSLGLDLFTRTTRALTLTSEERDMHERTLRLLQGVEEIEQAAVAARGEPAGIIQVTAPLPIGVNLLALALPRFRERYSKLSIDLRLGDRFTDLIEEGIDVAVRVGQGADSRLISRRLAPHRLCAFASPAYLTRHCTPQLPEDLAAHECVNFRYQSSGQTLRWPFDVGERVLEILPDAGIVVDVSDAVAAILWAGGGIGISPTYIAAPYVRRGELVSVLEQFMRSKKFDITALWPESRRGNPNAKAFVGFLGEVFPSPAPWDVLIGRG